MNIIQIQDRLKGLPEDALVNYVKNPMGEVPIYLALGEMQRRKDMKARFDANKPEEPSIAEQLVAEAEPMQMGLGAMAPQQMMPEGQGVGAPQPQQAVDPRQMAASGIAANPQSAVGGTAMMAEGGIVGYQEGGSIGNIIEPLDEYNPFPNTLANIPYMAKVDSREAYIDKLKKDKAGFGLDPDFYSKEQERLKEERLGYKTDRDQAINLGLIQAGLGIAGGTSANALENIAAGAMPALASTTKSLGDIKKEQRLLDKESSLMDRAYRAETLGDIKEYGTYKSEIQKNQIAQLGLFYDYTGKQLTADATKGSAEYELRLKILAEARATMEGKYNKDALLTRFAGKKQDFAKEFADEFKSKYKIATGSDYKGEIPQVTALGGLDDNDSKGLELKPGVVTRSNSSGVTEYIMLVNGQYKLISESEAFTKKTKK